MLHGRMDLVISSCHHLELGEIYLELSGYEELHIRNDVILESFLSSRIPIQANGLPLTRAVKGKCKMGFWKSVKGHYSFHFGFKLPKDVPCSTDFKSIFHIIYKVKGFIQFRIGELQDTVYESYQPLVVQHVPNSILINPSDRIKIRNIITAHHLHGDVPVQCTLTSLAVRVGQEILIKIMILNRSNKPIISLKTFAFRQIHILE